jgi:signal transduction histidine kinase
MEEEELRKIEKQESLGVLVGDIAHDFNNLLTPILGYIGLSLSAAGLDGDVRNNLVEAEKAAIKAKDLISQLRTFSKECEIVKK